MSDYRFTRRQVLRGVLFTASAIPFVACGAAPAAAPTAAPAAKAAAPTSAPAAAAPTTAPAAAPAASGSVANVRMWVHWGGKQLDALNEIITKYNTTKGTTDNAKVVVEPIADAELLQKMTAAHIAGTAPDVFHSWVSVPDQVKNAMSAPLPQEDAAWAKTWFHAGAIDMVSRSGQIWSYPTEYQSAALVYRKSFLKEAGAKLPTTTAELQALAKQLTKTEGGKTRYGFAQSTTNGNDFYAVLLKRFGGKYATFEGDKPIKLDLSSETALEAVTWLSTFVTDKSTNAGAMVQEDAWRNGLACMGELDVYFPITELRDGGKKDVFDDLATIVAPSKAGVGPATTCRGLFLHGEKASKVSDQRFKFMRWMMDGPDMPFSKFIVETIGSQPAVKSYPLPIKGWPEDFAAGYLKAAEIAEVAPRWKMLGNEEMGKVLKTMLESVLLGKATPKEALATADQTMQPILKRTNP